MFTYTIQYAGYPYDKYDEKGEINFATFISVIHSFPWIDQLKNYERIKEGCSPTVAVTDFESGNSLWISIAGDENKYKFLMGYVYIRDVRSWPIFGKRRKIKWVDIYILEDLLSADDIISSFFVKNFELLSDLLSIKEVYDRMPANQNKLS